MKRFGNIQLPKRLVQFIENYQKHPGNVEADIAVISEAQDIIINHYREEKDLKVIAQVFHLLTYLTDFKDKIRAMGGLIKDEEEVEEENESV